jgi:hypothetical protein
MPTFTELLPPTKSDAHPGILWTPGIVPGTGELVIQGDRSYARYRVADIATPWHGTAARFVKLTEGTDREAEAYDVFVAAPGSRDYDRCDCRGFERFGHCKHTAALRCIAVENPWLSRAELVNPEADTGPTEVPDPTPAPVAPVPPPAALPAHPNRWEAAWA